MFDKDSLYLQDLEFCAQSISIEQDVSFLVTGASGLIGTFVVDALMKYREKSTYKIDVTVTGRDYSKMKARFQHYNDDEGLHIFQHDIKEELPKEKYFDYIIHLASNADPRSYALYPVETIATNVQGAINILEYLRQHKNSKAVISSTFEVYGKLDYEGEISEDAYGIIDYNQIRSGYPESKRVAELLIRSYVEEYGVSAVIVRLSSIYGPTMTKSDNKAAAQFIRKAVKYEDIVLKSKGLQKRSYTYVADCVAGIFEALFKGMSGEAYNVCNPKSKLTISELAQIAAQIAGTEVKYELPDELEQKGFGNAKDSVMDGSKLMALGFAPQYDAVTGMNRTVEILKRMGIC